MCHDFIILINDRHIYHRYFLYNITSSLLKENINLCRCKYIFFTLNDYHEELLNILEEDVVKSSCEPEEGVARKLGKKFSRFTPAGKNFKNKHPDCWFEKGYI